MLSGDGPMGEQEKQRPEAAAVATEGSAGVEPPASSTAGVVTSSGDERGDTGETGVSGGGLSPPASTLRGVGREGDIMTKRRRR